MGWREHAACRGKDTAIFFSADGERGQSLRRRYARAKAICARCPVQPECLQDALEADDRYGVIGNTTPDERDAMLGRFVAAGSDHDDDHDDTVIGALVSGASMPDPGVVNIAYACVQLWRTGGIRQADLARRFGVTSNQVRNWVARTEAGSPPIDPRWLAQRRALAQRVERIVPLDPEVDDGRDESAIERLMAGEKIPYANRVDIAHALVRMKFQGGQLRALARRFDVHEKSAQRWVKRASSGLFPIDPAWLAEQQARRERVRRAS